MSEKVPRDMVCDISNQLHVDTLETEIVLEGLAYEKVLAMA